MSLKEGLTLNDYTDEAAALIVGETYNCATVAEEIEIVAKALRDAREKAIAAVREAREEGAREMQEKAAKVAQVEAVEREHHFTASRIARLIRALPLESGAEPSGERNQ